MIRSGRVPGPTRVFRIVACWQLFHLARCHDVGKEVVVLLVDLGGVEQRFRAECCAAPFHDGTVARVGGAQLVSVPRIDHSGGVVARPGSPVSPDKAVDRSQRIGRASPDQTRPSLRGVTLTARVRRPPRESRDQPPS